MINGIIDVVVWKYAGKKFQCGETYESLEWYDESAKPTLADIEAADAEYTLYLERTAYIALRKKAYPPIEDQLDMIYHHGIDGWKQLIRSIKEEYPK